MEVRDRILIIEDDRSIRKFFRTILEANRYDVISADTGEEGYSLITSQCPDLVILDLGLPDIDGMEILSRLRKWSGMPVVVISARSHEKDKVEALDLGADDYITKPFNPVEVLARVRSQLRRYLQLGGSAPKPAVLRIGGVELDDNAKTVTLDGEPVALTPKEYDILHFLMQNPGKVFSPAEIYRTVWAELPLNADNALAVHIRHIREKIEINPADPRYIKVVWGKGYKMEADAK